MISWSMVSKAFFRSVNMTPFQRPLSILIDQLFVVSSRAVWVLQGERKPDW